MCDSPVRAYLACNPLEWFGNFFINTKQYREFVQLGKEYIFFTEKYLKRFETVHTVYVPCGKCIQCLESRSKSWEIRSVYEMLNHERSCCLTLTYDDEHLPICADFVYTKDGLVRVPEDKKGIIDYKDVQDFIKRLRKYFKFRHKIRYICSCEYGSNGTLRPHFHILLFNFDVSLLGEDIRKLRYRRSKKGTILFKSPKLEKIWSKGFVDVGKADLQSCRYISQYCCKNLLKERKCKSNKFLLKIKNQLSRECLHASIGLGFQTFRRNYHSIIGSMKIVYGKFVYAIPKYFIKKLEFINLELYQNVKKKARDFWLNFKWTDDDQKRAKLKTEKILRKLNLFHSDMFGLLSS